MENKRILRKTDSVLKVQERQAIFKRDCLPARCVFGLVQLSQCIVYLSDVDFDNEVCTFKIQQRQYQCSPVSRRKAELPQGDDLIVCTHEDLYNRLLELENLSELKPHAKASKRVLFRNIKLKDILSFGYERETYPEDCPMYPASLEDLFSGRFYLKEETKMNAKRSELSPPVVRFMIAHQDL